MRVREIIAHRGHGSEPENTMRALRKGHEVGADRIEFDIQHSADGDYVVIHDPTVDRTTNGTGEVGKLTTAQLRELDAGKGERLPLFTEVIDWSIQNDVKLDIEVKHPHPGDEKELAEIVRGSGLKDPWVMSFDGEFVERFEDLAPEVTTAVLVHERPLLNRAIQGAGLGLAVGLGVGLAAHSPILGGVLGTVAGALGGYRLEKARLRRKDLDKDVDLHIPGSRILSKKLIDKAHRLGKDVGVYTVDSGEKARKFAGWGVDAIISNYPDRIKAEL